MFPPILILAKNICELGNNVNPTSKKLKFSNFFTLYVPTKTLEGGRKTRIVRESDYSAAAVLCME